MTIQSQQKQTRSHIAVLPSPGLGHLIPLLEFAKRLVLNHNVHVSFLVINIDHDSAAKNHILHSTILPPGLHVIDLPPLDTSSVITDDMLLLTRLCVMVEENLKSLKSILVDLNDLQALVIDLFCTQTIEICRELSIHVYSFFTPSAYCLTFGLYLPTLDKQTEGEIADLPDPISIPGCSPLRMDDLIEQVRVRKNDQYKWFLYHMNGLLRVDGILANTWEDFEPVSLKAIREHPFYKQIPPVYPVGPMIKPEEQLSPSDEECLTWLDNQPSDSVLFIALGSGGTLSREQLVEMAWGLEMSQQRFIWVLRKPNDADASSTFFNVGSEIDVNDPKSYLPEGFLEKTSGVGLVIKSWASQVGILRHKSIGGFLCHCGWNSVLESVFHGVAMIAWPLYAEQKMNATSLEEEIGVAVKPVRREGDDVVRREEMSRVVKLLMEGDEGKRLKCRVKELKDSACRSLEDGGSSCLSLCSAVEKWKGSRIS